MEPGTLCNPWTVAHQSPLSMEFSGQEYWMLEWVAFPGDLPPRDQTWVSCIAGRFLYHLSHQGSPPVDHSARSGCCSLQPGPPGSNTCPPPTFARASCNVTGPMSISSYCPGPHEAQYRGPNPEHSPPGQSECLWADGPGDGGLANQQHEPSSPSRRQVRS